jgi:hypothetical protein
MALQSSGQITLSEIWGEYNSGATPGANENISLGTLSTNTADGGGDPDAMSEFYGLSSAPAFVANENFTISTYTGNGGTQSIIGPSVGEAAYFNGTSGRIATGLTLPADSTMSFSFWLKFDSNTSGNNYFLSDFDSGASNNSTRISLAITANHGFRAWMSNGSSNWSTTDAIDLSHYLDKWFNLVVTLNGSTMKVYVNGGTPTTLTMSISFGTAGSRQLTIGRAGDLAGAYYEGHLDDIRIYTKELSATEVGYIANNTISSIPTGDLLAHYKLDGNANDAQGSYNGTASNITYTSNAAISSIGFLGQGVDFNGSVSSKIDTGINMGTYEDDYSMSFWFKTMSYNSSFRGCLGTTTESSNYSNGLIVDQGLSGEMRWRFRKSGSSYNLTSTGTYTDGEWHHFVGIKDGTTIKLYIDGDAEIITATVPTGITHNTTLRIGTVGLVTSASVFALDGSIGDFRLYNDVLTAQEVLNIYNNTSIPTDNLITHYKFNGNANDEQGNFNGTANDVGWVGSNFKPDFVWIKDQEDGSVHVLFDSIRGATKYLSSSSTAAEATGATLLTSFDSTGFTVGGSGAVNQSGKLNVGWSWKAGGTGVSNTDGSVTSIVSANQEAGFSIVKHNGTSSNNTVGHGLSSETEFIINKNLVDISNWSVCTNLAGLSYGSHKLLLTSDAGKASDTNEILSANSTTFTVGTSGATNGSGDDVIHYCFHSVDGYQRFTSYTGNNNATGPIVYLDSNGDNTGTGGFKPRWVMIKRTDSTGNWILLDHLRKDGSSGNNSASDPDLISDFLEPNTTDPRTAGTNARIKLLNNGFQVVTTAAYMNASGGTYLAWAIA